MSEIKLELAKREITGKKLAKMRKEGMIPSVVYGGQAEPLLGQSEYNLTEKTLKLAGYHSPVTLEIGGKKQLAIVKNVDVDPVTRKIRNVEFLAVSANEVVEATAPIVVKGFEASEANKIHLVLLQVMEEIEVKAKPAELPKEIVVDGEKLATIDDKITVADLMLPKGVELADKELDAEQVVASLYDPTAEAAAREAETEETVSAAEVPLANEKKETEE